MSEQPSSSPFQKELLVHAATARLVCLPADNSRRRAYRGFAIAADVVAALQWGPKETAELVEVVGISRGPMCACLAALHASGAVARKLGPRKVPKRGGRQPLVWVLQNTPFAIEDEG